MDLFCLFQRDYMNTVQSSVQKGLIGQSLEDFQQDILSIATGLFYLKFVHFLKLFFYKLKNVKKIIEFENTSKIVLELSYFVAFFYSVNFFRSLTSLCYLRVQVLFFFMHLDISRVTSKITSILHIFNFFYLCVLYEIDFSTARQHMWIFDFCCIGIFVFI